MKLDVLEAIGDLQITTLNFDIKRLIIEIKYRN